MTTFPSRLLPMASSGCSCCGPSSPPDTDTGSAPPAAPEASAGGSATDYQVTGLTCGHCTARVTDALQVLPKVDDVNIALVAGGVSTVTVTGAVPAAAIRRALEQAGYPLVDS